ncbi:MAG: S41 family peptidase [Burkholderiales bacterium]|nr:S41 family peptidase [Burkholderiales bacterium]
MNSKWKSSGLIGVGVVAGVLLGLNFSAVAQREARSPLPLAEIQTLAEVFGNIKQAYVDTVDDKKLLTGAVKGMLTELDPHSSYLDPEENKEFETGIRGEFGGLGIEVGTEEGFVKVVSPIEDTPAARAGIRAGDLIVKIDDTSTKGISLTDAVKRMRGKPKTSIKLTIARKGENRPIEITLVREVIRVQSVKSKLIEPGVAHIRVTQFQERTVEDLARNIERMYKESGGKLTGLVLDMRNNPGGLLHSAIGVSAAFLESRTVVVSSNGRLPDTKHSYLATPEEYSFRTREDALRNLPPGIKTVPIVVLVNDGSASASEIVAGALQDHKRAVVMGQTTFGKGSVQTKLNLNNGAGMKLTTARYYTPSGRSIQAKGIIPDWIVGETASGPTRGPRMREADLANHLTNDRDPDAEKPGAPQPAAPEADKKEDAKPPARIEFGSAEDFQFQQALNLLKGQPVKGEKSAPQPGPRTAEAKK